jgi:hypothetical protein
VNDHPNDHIPAPWCPRNEVVLPDAGGWLSGPSITAETVTAEAITAGDRLVLDDGTIGEVDDIRHGWYWLDDGHGPGIALGWRSLNGKASGVLFRSADDELCRIERPAGAQ